MLDIELPYELRALETALYEAVRLLDAQVAWLEEHVPRAADDLARGVSPAKLERVREAKRAIKAVGGRARRLSAALRGILDDDDDMLVRPITRTKKRCGGSPWTASPCPATRTWPAWCRNADGDSSEQSEAGSSSSLATSDWAVRQAGGGGGGGVPRASPHDVEDCENLLEFYYVQAEALLGRLEALTERIDDTEDLVNIDLDNRRNQIVGIDLVVTSITLMFTFVTSVAGIFGMNMRNTMEDSVVAFYVTTVASFLGGLLMCAAFLGYVVQRRLLMLPTANGGGGCGVGGWGWFGGGGRGGGEGWGAVGAGQLGFGGGGMGGDGGSWFEGEGEGEGGSMWTWGRKDKVA
ncbi:hypothetical protein VOLCADRAFT_55719 [Volvox carteri f. nagariensis]|uniref:Magnesium transporter n=1 Tax=Volvox carteri f. nagariensis TaxID=3068 RepID=D8TJH1_VOLCA|nr:uncharacterized protein VOLCADRAFT_55719 [Volvox carteri f. nagariensis]EFJ52373.1 hypothetical protein VOLCADRAFT_55719 [Volvox carteri f. nagariensis]|eukprot:XP_002946446.1 hypothetical protein VOLCADRAFT_55719 [Volvox carteri f. nagariensis]